MGEIYGNQRRRHNLCVHHLPLDCTCFLFCSLGLYFVSLLF
ncbi:unnamed protein product [Rhodiola kirilowii]